MYPRLVLKAVDDGEMAKPLLVGPFGASRVIDGTQLGLEDPRTWPAPATLTSGDMHSPVAKHGGTFCYRGCNVSMQRSCVCQWLAATVWRLFQRGMVDTGSSM